MALQKPGPTAGPTAGKFAPGTTAKLSAAREPPVAPARPRLPSKTDEIDTQTGAPTERKGVTPRAPSVVSSNEVTAPAFDIRQIVLGAVKEATAPLETRIAQLEGRLALVEADVRERGAAEETRRNIVMPAAMPQMPAAMPALPAAVPAPPAFVPAPPAFVAPAFAPSPFSDVSVSASAFPPAPAAPSPAPPLVVAAPPMRPAFVSASGTGSMAPLMNFEDAHLSPDEIAMFDGNKRGRRMTIYFVLVLLVLGGLLGLWAAVSR